MSIFHSGLGKEKISEILKNKKIKIHFVGVGGVGMYSLCVLSKEAGYEVSGSDREISHLCNSLIDAGYDVKIGHAEENASGAGLIVYSLAIAEDNPEIRYAERNGIPGASRAEYLGFIMENYKKSISVSGSHGKSTTTAMISEIFKKAGCEPTVVLGAALPNTDCPVHIGKEELLICEGCEYKDSFLHFSPSATVFTNLELDHVDYFDGIEALKRSFLKAMNLPELSVVNIDDENLRELIPFVKTRTVTFGESSRADYKVLTKEWKGGFYRLKIRHEGEDMLDVCLSVPGRFNAINAAAAATVALEAGIARDSISRALSEFCGIERRMEKLCTLGRCEVYYDYAHHPTEIRSVISAIREMTGKEVTVIFKPHTYSRTAGLMKEFVSALSLADKVFICEISAIREKAIDGINASSLVSRIGDKAAKLNDDDVLDAIGDIENSAIIIMGAANLDKVKKMILESEKTRKNGRENGKR